MADTILKVRDLKKSFHAKGGSQIRAVRGISFSVERGEIFGFLGPNGAGKSTTITMLTTGLRPDGGEILLDGRSVIRHPEEARARIGVVAQHNNLDRSLTARENLLYHAAYFGMDRTDAERRAADLLERFGLAERSDDYVSGYSGGMAQRLKIARAMMHRPDVLFLDEPTTGLDPNYREILWEQMMELNRAGTTIFLTTHYMEEPERFCEHIAIVNAGELKAAGTTEELKALIPSRDILVIQLDALDDAMVAEAEELPGVQKATVQGGALMLYMDDGRPDFDGIIRWVNGWGKSLRNISLGTSTLDDVFVHLCGSGINGEEGR